MVLPYVIIAILIISGVYLLIRYFELRAKYIEIKRELNAQSLDYHLNKIHEAGYEYTIRHRKEHKGSSKDSKNSKNSKRASSKNKKRAFDEIINA